MKRNSLLLFLLLWQSVAFAQQNILLNSSFDYGIGNWYSILSVDECTYPGTMQEGIVYTASGPGCAGVRFYHETHWEDEKNWQEYIYQNIHGQMHPDTTYRVSVKFRLAGRCTTATNVMGIGFFSNYPNFNMITQEVIRAKTPEISNVSGELLDNNRAYKELVGYYTATGQESFVAIGAFHTDTGMVRLPTSTGPLNPNELTYPLPEILYFIDDAKIVPCNDYPPDVLQEDVHISCSPEVVHLDATVSYATYNWSTGDTTATIDVISDNQTVWVEITKNGCVRTDTIQLKVFSGDFELGPDSKVCSVTELPVNYVVIANPGEQITWSNGLTGNLGALGAEGTYWAVKTLGQCSASDTISIYDFSNHTGLYPNPVSTTFSISNAEEVHVRQLISEDGKYIFSGYELLESLDNLIISLPPAVYYIDADVNGCRLFQSFEKIKINH